MVGGVTVLVVDVASGMGGEAGRQPATATKSRLERSRELVFMSGIGFDRFGFDRHPPSALPVPDDSPRRAKDPTVVQTTEIGGVCWLAVLLFGSRYPRYARSLKARGSVLT